MIFHVLIHLIIFTHWHWSRTIWNCSLESVLGRQCLSGPAASAHGKCWQKQHISYLENVKNKRWMKTVKYTHLRCFLPVFFTLNGMDSTFWYNFLKQVTKLTYIPEKRRNSLHFPSLWMSTAVVVLLSLFQKDNYFCRIKITSNRPIMPWGLPTGPCNISLCCWKVFACMWLVLVFVFEKKETGPLLWNGQKTGQKHNNI